MRTFALGTGSEGNCIFIESSLNKKILVDIGFSFKYIKKILMKNKIDIFQIDAIFLTHEHIDHSKSLNLFFKKTNSKVYMSLGTFKALNINDCLKDFLLRIVFVKDLEVLHLYDLKILPINKSHDCLEPLSFIFENKKKIGVFTDLGVVNSYMIQFFKTLDILYIECSYCDDFINSNKLYNSLNSNYLNRLISSKGHLSLADCSYVLDKIMFENQIIILSHISNNANSYENCYKKIKSLIDKKNLNVFLLVSFQNQQTKWLE